MISLEVLKCQEVLDRYADHFDDDFQFEYVLADIPADVLTPAECTAILGAGDDDYDDNEERFKRQNERLLFALSTETHKLAAFINAIEEKYPWLARPMRAALRDDSKDEELRLVLAQIQELRNQIPRLETFNVPRKGFLFAIQQRLKRLQRGECLMLTGDLVYGKKWLAIDACSNYEIMQHMEQRVYVVNLDKCRSKEDILERMVALHNTLVGSDISAPPAVYDDSTANKIHALQRILRAELRTNHPDSLLLLCDVQSARALNAFKLHGKCMLTTRNKALLDEWPAHLRHDLSVSRGFSLAESLALFARVLSTTACRLPPQAQHIHELCAGSPFIVSLVASNLRDYQQMGGRWCKWVEMLERNESTSDEHFRNLIAQSLDELNAEQRVLFRSLAIFGDNIKIPLSLLQVYWGKSDTEVEQIVRKFDLLYLVETLMVPATACGGIGDEQHSVFGRPCSRNSDWSGGGGADSQTYCLLKYHYCSYLSHAVSAEEKLQMNRRLIEAYDISDLTDLRRFDDRYFYFYIGHHLNAAKRPQDIARLFLHLHFLEHKLRATGLPNTIGDLHTYRSAISTASVSPSASRALLNDLLEFLPNVEEMLKKSADTTLLQYALNSSGALRAAAHDQAAAEPQRVYMHGCSDHINRHRRQIVALPHRPTFIRFWGPNTALIAFADTHGIFLADLSPGYTVQPSLFSGHSAAIVDIQMLGGADFVSLDAAGVLLLWSMESTAISRRRSSSNGAASVDTTDGDGGDGGGGGFRSSTAAHIRQSRAESFDKHAHRHSYRQMIAARPAAGRIRCMALERRRTAAGGVRVHSLILGTDAGKLLIYLWPERQKGETQKQPELQYEIDLSTRMGDLRAMQMCAAQRLLVLSDSGALWLYNTKTSAAQQLLDGAKAPAAASAAAAAAATWIGEEPDSSQLPRSSAAAAAAAGAGNSAAAPAPLAISAGVIGLHVLSDAMPSAHRRVGATASGDAHSALVVFADCVRRVHFETNAFATLRTPVHVTQVFRPADCNRIACSCLSDDRRYLVLGTERGVVVLDVRPTAAASADTAGAQKVLRGRVSDRIACVDLHSLDGERYKYLLMCATGAAAGEQLSYMYALESDGRGALMQWAQLDPWLLGGQMFGVIRPDAAHQLQLVALDSKGILQYRRAEDGFAEATRMVCHRGGGGAAASPIVRISCAGDYVCVARSDGSVWDNRLQCRLQMDNRHGPITFLQCLERGAVVVAGTASSYRIAGCPVEVPSSQVRRAFLVGGAGGVVLLVKESACFDCWDLRRQEMVPCNEAQLEAQQRLGGCDLRADCLAIATHGELHVWRIREVLEVEAEAEAGVRISFSRRAEAHVRLLVGGGADRCTSVALSAGHELVACGFQSGAIRLYRLADEEAPRSRTQFLGTLLGHRSAVQSMLFAPWSAASQQPLVLASVAAELCFWNGTYVLNNPGRGRQATVGGDDDGDGVNGGRRRSARFREEPLSPLATPDEEATTAAAAAAAAEALFRLQLAGGGPWTGKMGAPGKPELLACIKFIGRVAEQLFANADFTRFLTVDDSGEIYHFELAVDEDVSRRGSESVALTSEASVSTSSLEDEVMEEAAAMETAAAGAARVLPVPTQLSLLRPLNGHYI